MSPTRTGPLTLRMMDRFWSSRKSIRTWVMPPRLPVRPRIMETLPSLTGCSCGDWDNQEDKTNRNKHQKSTFKMYKQSVSTRRTTLLAERSRKTHRAMRSHLQQPNPCSISAEGHNSARAHTLPLQQGPKLRPRCRAIKHAIRARASQTYHRDQEGYGQNNQPRMLGGGGRGDDAGGGAVRSEEGGAKAATATTGASRHTTQHPHYETFHLQ